MDKRKLSIQHTPNISRNKIHMHWERLSKMVWLKRQSHSLFSASELKRKDTLKRDILCHRQNYISLFRGFNFLYLFIFVSFYPVLHLPLRMAKKKFPFEWKDDRVHCIWNSNKNSTFPKKLFCWLSWHCTTSHVIYRLRAPCLWSLHLSIRTIFIQCMNGCISRMCQKWTWAYHWILVSTLSSYRVYFANIWNELVRQCWLLDEKALCIILHHSLFFACLRTTHSWCLKCIINR